MAGETEAGRNLAEKKSSGQQSHLDEGGHRSPDAGITSDPASRALRSPLDVVAEPHIPGRTASRPRAPSPPAGRTRRAGCRTGLCRTPTQWLTATQQLEYFQIEVFWRPVAHDEGCKRSDEADTVRDRRSGRRPARTCQRTRLPPAREHPISAVGEPAGRDDPGSVLIP